MTAEALAELLRLFDSAGIEVWIDGEVRTPLGFFDRTGGSQSLAAAGQRGRSAHLVIVSATT